MTQELDAAPAGRFPEMASLLGARYTESPFERSFYRRDLAAVPGYLGRFLGQTLPAAVARPQSAEEVATLVRAAAARRLPIVPRAAATTVYWNSVPVRGGLVLDLTGMRAIGAVDEATSSVTLGPGVRWEELERALAASGYATLAYPTSAPSATVGGWFNMEGYGIGSLAHGGMAGQVVRVEAVLADGRVIDTAVDGAYTPATFAGSEGTLGVITELTLRVRRAPARAANYLIACPDSAHLQRLALALASGSPRPFYMHFTAASYQQRMAAAGFPPASSGPLLALAFQGSAQEVETAERAVASAARDAGGQVLDQALADAEWQERFMALRLKRSGPTVLGAESWLPLERVVAYENDIARVAAEQRLPIATYGTVVQPGWATVMSLFPCDESRQLDYLLALSLTRQLFKTAFRHGGRPYGIGLWSTPYLSQAASRREWTERRRRKRELDPLNLMNPGKRYAPPLLLAPPVFDLGMGTLALLRRAVGGRI